MDLIGLIDARRREHNPEREQAMLEHIGELTSDGVHALGIEVGVGLDGGDRP